MVLNKTYGIKFPFKESQEGTYVSLTKTVQEEVRADLLHLILTRKGSRYYLPDFGTRIYEFIFEPMDGTTFEAIKDDIRESVKKYIPNLEIEQISIEPYTEDESSDITKLTFEEEPSEYQMFDIYRTAGQGVDEYTAKIRIEYSVTDSTFNTRDFIIINI
jgi:phage baseplate assembly protein W